MSYNFSTIDQLKNNLLLSDLINLAHSKNIYGRIIHCGDFSEASPNGGFWFVYGNNKDKILDNNLSQKITEILNSRNEVMYFYLDFNLIQITNNNPIVVYSKVADNINLIRFITQCFQDVAKPVPDLILTSDAVNIIKTYEAARKNSANQKKYENNIDILSYIIKKSDTTTNPLHPQNNTTPPAYYYSGISKLAMFYIKHCKKIKNQVSAEHLFRCATDVQSCTITDEMKEILKKELSDFPNILFYISKKTYPNFSSRNPLYKKRKNDRVYTFMYSKQNSHIIYDIIVRHTYPEAKKHTYSELIKKYDKVDTFICPKKRYIEFMQNLVLSNIPFYIDTNYGDINEDFFRIVYPAAYQSYVSSFIPALKEAAHSSDIHAMNIPVNSSFLTLTSYRHAENSIKEKAKNNKNFNPANSFEYRNQSINKEAHIAKSLKNTKSYW